MTKRYGAVRSRWADLEEVQKRRELRGFVQRLQIIGHRRINGRTSGSGDSLPFIPRLFARFPILRALPALLIGVVPRPEHIRSTQLEVRSTNDG
jgi:hypothetical protein